MNNITLGTLYIAAGFAIWITTMVVIKIINSRDKKKGI